jgi:hypothetical protein
MTWKIRLKPIKLYGNLSQKELGASAKEIKDQAD